MTDERPAIDPMARAARTLGIVTAVLTGLVAFNTLVISCASDRDARERAVLERLEGDERFWTAAMKDLSDLVAKKPAAGPTANWDAQCGMLAERTVKLVADDLDRTSDEEIVRSTAEIDEEFPRAREIRTRVRVLRDFFQARMQDPALIGTCASNFATKLEQAEQANSLVWPDIAAKIGYTITPDTLDAIDRIRPTIALTPASSNRWDIDVFWCARADAAAQSANYTRAVVEGLKLAAWAQRGDRIGNERLGQVRVRTLTQSAQAIRGRFVYLSKGNRFLFDRGDRAEQALVNALVAQLNSAGVGGAGGELARGPILAQEQGRPSRWYLSLFVCEAEDPPGATAPADEATAPDSSSNVAE